VCFFFSLRRSFGTLIRIVLAEVGTDAAPKARREKKEAFRIDFLTPAEKDFKEVTTELFAPVKRGAGINLPGTSKSRKGKGKAAAAARDRDLHLLPDDMHFSSRHLVTLFLKPQFAVSVTGIVNPV
jgi:condensin complex subunit 2